MAGNNGPSQRRALGAEIGSLGREELITLARAVCGQAASFSGGHGNIHPENIFLSVDGSPWLGGRADHAPGEWTTDELEYMAPELFWSGALDARADVYSVGLLLYAGVTRGRLPFFACAANEMTNELRAAALRRRMNGEPIPIPTIAGEKLGEVLKRALSFEPEVRYSDTIELSMALEPCVGEGDAAAMAMFGKPESELSEVERTMAGILASYSAEEIAAVPEPELKRPAPEPETDFETVTEPETESDEASIPETGPEPERNLSAGLSACSDSQVETAPAEADTAQLTPPEQPGDVGAAAAEAVSVPAEEPAPPPRQPETVQPEPGSSEPNPEPSEAPDAVDAPPAPPTPPEPPRPEVSDREEKPQSTLLFVVAICAIVAVAALALNYLLPRMYPAEPVVIPTPTATVQPSATPSPTAEPTPAATPEPTPAATPTPESTANFEVVRSDISWTDAEQRAREMGGHLAIIRSEADFNRITSLAEAQGLDFVWIGLFRVNGALQWVDPAAEGWYNWGPGQPSVTDTDGTAENFVLLWHTDSGWVYNDSRNNPAAAYPSSYSGRIGFVCEYD